MAQADADACIDHVFSAAPAAGQGEEGIFIGLVEGADGTSIGIHVVTETSSKVPLFFRIEIQRMKCRQSSCPGANPVQAIVKPVHISIHTADQTLQLTHIHRIGITGPRCHIVNLLAAHGDIAVCDFHGMSIVAISGNLDAAAGDGRTGFAFTVVDGQAVVVQSTIARGDAGQPCKFAGQPDIQAIASGVLDHTDVAICQLRRICAAGQFHGFAQASGDGFSIIPGKVPAAQLANFRLGSLTGKGLHIADIGRIGIIAVVLIDDTALHVSDVFATSVNALAVNRDIASLDGAVITKIHLVVQLDVDGLAIFRNSRSDIAIPMDANGTAQVCLDSISLVICQAEAAALVSVSDTALHLLQLFFCSSPANFAKVRQIDTRIRQTRDGRRAVGAIEREAARHGDAVDIRQILSQLDIKTITRDIGYYADVFVGELRGISSTGQLQRAVQQARARLASSETTT